MTSLKTSISKKEFLSKAYGEQNWILYGAAFSFNSQNVTGGTYNALTLTAAATGFTIAGGSVAGYITITDLAGNTRKVAVVA